MPFYANELFPWNSDQTNTKILSVQLQTVYDTCLYLEWLQSYPVLTPLGPFSHNSNHMLILFIKDQLSNS